MAATHYRRMDRAELSRQLARGTPNNEDRRRGFALVSVAERRSYAAQHIPGSINIPLGEERRFEMRFEHDKQIIVYGGSFDSPDSARVARDLALRGFTAVYDYEGGLIDWRAGGKPVEH
jgi:rhodanese-related sulfurtransferase